MNLFLHLNFRSQDAVIDDRLMLCVRLKPAEEVCDSRRYDLLTCSVLHVSYIYASSRLICWSVQLLSSPLISPSFHLTKIPHRVDFFKQHASLSGIGMLFWGSETNTCTFI